MGRRKKKPFINKREAQTYRLVPRSQNDPKAGDLEEAQYVLKLEGTQEAEESRVLEQKKYGVYFEDGYDYLQHLKAPGSAVLEPAGLGCGDGTTGKQGLLPGELFGEEVSVQGQLEKVMPVSGPRPDWDPEIVEALENAEVSSEPGQDLEDDFVLLANSGEVGLPVYVMEEADASDDPCWWKNRPDFAHSRVLDSADSDGEDSVSSGKDSTLGNLDDVCGQSEKRTARFTEYSMTSSVVPRSEALTLLDDRFEEFMAEYNAEQLGAGEEEGADLGLLDHDRQLLETAMEDFNKNFKEESKHIDDEDRAPQLCQGEEFNVESEEEESCSESSEEEMRDIVEVYETPKEERMDCESILSTYSTLYNHPTRITEPRKSKPPGSEGEIKLSRKTGMPLGVIPGPLPKEHHPSRGTITRPRNEDKEEKKARKLAMKQDRKQRRADKKSTKLAFKAETLKQGKSILNQSAITAVV